MRNSNSTSDKLLTLIETDFSSGFVMLQLNLVNLAMSVSLFEAFPVNLRLFGATRCATKLSNLSMEGASNLLDSS